MKKYVCNPVNVAYRYQFNMDKRVGRQQIAREAADPSMVVFKGKYYIFASMTLEYWESEDLVTWKQKRLPDTLPLYDYAPDVRVVDEYLYFSASARGRNCNYYRTKDLDSGVFEEFKGTFDFWDPNLFLDDDGKLYFYWGCSNQDPIYGVELDKETMKPITEKKAMISGHPETIGYERFGEDHSKEPASDEMITMKMQGFAKMKGIPLNSLPPQMLGMLRNMFADRPYIEGAWMTKYNGKYYLQYAFPGAEFNTYGDGVYVSSSPLGPFELAKNNPYSYKPGGFMNGAGHGSTMEDKYGNWWHVGTIRVSINHQFERRVGFYPAGFDKDGELFCNQRYGDWPLAMEDAKMDPWKNPEWFLLSYGKATKCSSCVEGKDGAKAVDECNRTWWRAASNKPGEYIEVDLGKAYDVRAIQINFADDGLDMACPGDFSQGDSMPRYIDTRDDHVTTWKLEGSLDGENYFSIEDKWNAKTNLEHDLVVCENGIEARYVRLTVNELPWNQDACVSGLRVFGIGHDELPSAPEFEATDMGNNTIHVKMTAKNATGYNILWGYQEDKLYHSYMVYGEEHDIKAIIKGQDVYMRVDAFNESGITEGTKAIKVL